MFSSVLIANRGEIACRIARTAKRMGMRTIAVYSDADRNAMHVRLCDEAHHIGGSPPRDSYLRIDRIMGAVRTTQAECVHPGYGFLAENAEFAEACASARCVFVGPPPSAIRAMGLKDSAKALMEKAGVPVVPGYHGDNQKPDFLKSQADQIAYPVMIKPIAGGGGKGMRRVDTGDMFADALAGAMREATSAFGDPRVLVEKFIRSPRHIEIQVFADQHGNVIHLNERDCSLQRRHQKIIEEAPAPGMTPQMRAAMGAAATRAAAAVGYVGAGTVEFIASGASGLRADEFWFMEMNTRLQVEHPVTEATTGLDLVEWQFRIAAGERLPLTQAQVSISGHAVEARVYAEDPEHGFIPSTGRVGAIKWPAAHGVRVDAGVESGSEVTPYYDPMLAKIIAHAPTREEALNKLAQALEQSVVAGPRSNIAFLLALCRHERFRSGAFDTGFIDRQLSDLLPAPGDDPAAIAAGIVHLLKDRQSVLRERIRSRAPASSPWDAQDAFQLSGKRRVPLVISAGGRRVAAEVTYEDGGASVSVDGVRPAVDAQVVAGDGAVYVLREGRQTVVRFEEGSFDLHEMDGGGIVRAPMHGKVLALFVEKGQSVEKGQRIAVIEAMKMEHMLTAAITGVVAEITTAEAAQVAEGAALVVIEPAK